MYDCIFWGVGGKAFLGAALVVAQDTTVEVLCLCLLSELCLSWFLCRSVVVCCCCCFVFLVPGISRRGKTIDSVGLGEPGGSCMEMTCLTPCLLISFTW